MRLFHVSEEPDIVVFHPRLPVRADLDPTVGLVWAVDEARLPNFLTPRDCPRVTYHSNENTTEADRNRFLSKGKKHAVILENRWRQRMMNTPLYLYEFSPEQFFLQDPVAGYYVSKVTQTPLKKHIVTEPLAELYRRNVEVQFLDSLWEVAAAVQKSSLNWSLCRMKYAK